MSAVSLLAFGAISALGEGAAAVTAGEVSSAARTVIARDRELVEAGLARPFAARALPWDTEMRAATLIERALTSCASELDRKDRSWRGERVGLVLGTSSGGMRSAEVAFASVSRGEGILDREAPTYFGPMARAARVLALPFDPALLVLGACASSAIAIGLATRWLESGRCDIVLAGGFDEVTVFVAAGFESLRATTNGPVPRPFRLGRDGMALGEGAAVLALARGGHPLRTARAFIVGFGAASDAVHLTAPDREGRGLAGAAAAALEEALRPRVDLVSAHATATPFNDAAESRAIAAALGGSASSVVVHPFKAQIGHTMGAAGALELLAAIDGMERGVFPAAAGEGPLDPDCPVRLLDRAAAGAPAVALKLASAFGGANAALVASSRPDGVVRRRRPVFVHSAVFVPVEPPLEELASSIGSNVDRLARGDGLVRLALAAIAQLTVVSGSLAGAGVVVGTSLATVETNARFAARLRERGARAVEPRLFPYTSPNAVAGECSILFGLTGPSFSVGGGLHAAVEAIAAAAVLIEGGDCERIVVVAADDVGPMTRALAGDVLRSGAVAVLLSAKGGVGARARIGDISLQRGRPADPSDRAGHRALLPLLEPVLPNEIACGSPPDASGCVTLLPTSE